MGEPRTPGRLSPEELDEQMRAMLRLVSATVNKIDIEAVNLGRRAPGGPGGGDVVAIDSFGTAGTFGSFSGCFGTAGTFGSAVVREN